MAKNPTLKERITKVETKVEHIEEKVNELNDGQHIIVDKIDRCGTDLNVIDMKLTKFIVDHMARADERTKITKDQTVKLDNTVRWIKIGSLIASIIVAAITIWNFIPK